MAYRTAVGNTGRCVARMELNHNAQGAMTGQYIPYVGFCRRFDSGDVLQVRLGGGGGGFTFQVNPMWLTALSTLEGPKYVTLGTNHMYFSCSAVGLLLYRFELKYVSATGSSP